MSLRKNSPHDVRVPPLILIVSSGDLPKSSSTSPLPSSSSTLQTFTHVYTRRPQPTTKGVELLVLQEMPSSPDTPKVHVSFEHISYRLQICLLLSGKVSAIVLFDTIFQLFVIFLSCPYLPEGSLFSWTLWLCHVFILWLFSILVGFRLWTLRWKLCIKMVLGI